MVRKIDVHNHFYPEAFIQAVQQHSRYSRIEPAEGDDLLIHYEGDYSVIVRSHRDPEHRIEDLDRAGMDMQILSLTVPGVHHEPVDEGIALARLTNDAFGEIVSKHPDRYGAFATLPTQSPDEAARELERSVNELGLAGAMIFSNHAGKSLDHQSFWPVYEAAGALDVPLLVHPYAPAGMANLEDLRMVALIGFPFDVTIAASRLVLSGVLDRFPKLTFIMSQLGGAIPMLAERLDRGSSIYPELAGTLQRKPSEYLSDMFFDTVPYGEIGIPLTYQFAGAERILLASDHPHQIGNLDGCTDVIDAMDIPDGDKAKMLGGNAERLFRLTDNG
jgi:aminocarboxymuconate-semialdehyde decarboxylase